VKRAFIVAALVLFAVLVSLGMKPDAAPQFLSPGELAVSPDGQRLYVLCEKSDEVLVVDAGTSQVTKHIRVGHMPRGISVSSDGKQIYVANSWTDTVSIIDAEKLEVTRAIPTGFEPISAVADRSNETLYVANRLSSDISVIDLASGKEIKRLSSGRGASYLAISHDGSQVFATHIYSHIGEPRTPPESEITVINTSTRRVADRKQLNNVAGVFHMALASDGGFGVAAQLRPKNLVPLAHVEHGWAFGDSLALFGKDIDGVVQVPLDELERYTAMPFSVALTPDNTRLFVSAAGSDNIVVVDVPALLASIRNAKKPIANDLSASANYVTARIPVGHNPRGIVLSPDGKRLYVADRMDDTISVLDTKSDQVINTIDLGGSKALTPARSGERNFNNAKFSFQGQYSCSNCHLDATFDGLQWDLEPDGFGVDVVDNRPIYNLLGTQPFKWNGGNPDLPTECGPRTEKYFYRSQSFNEKELTDLVAYLVSLPAPPNRYRLPNGNLTPAQERGKAIFERIKTKSGQPIPEGNRCGTCHSGPKYTNNKSEDVGTGKPIDRSPLVDTPQLPDIAYSAPYLHDGSARSLEEIWTMFNPKDQHGVTNDLTKDELNDLIEYLRTL
jgi:YVTN family beta-propeller protein